MNDLFNNNSNEDEKEDEKELNKKKTLKTYKFHMLHHNGLLKTLKKNGIDINSINDVFNNNDSLFIELLKSNNENMLKKSVSEINLQNNKNITNQNSSKFNQNFINVQKSKNDSYSKKNKTIKSEEKENKKSEGKNSDNKQKTRNSVYSLKSNIKIKKRFSLDSNKQYANSLNNSNSKIEESKSGLKSKKRRGSVQILPNKIYLSINEDNYYNYDDEIQIVNESNSNFPSKYKEKNKLKENNKLNNNTNTLFQKISIQTFPKKVSKRNNSTLTHVSNYSNNNYLIQNNEITIKNSLPGIKHYNKIFYVNNNRKPHYKFKRNNSLQPYFIKGGVNFKKMLSRAYLEKISNNIQNIYSTITPNYLAIEPKCIMKVTYKNKKYNLQRPPFKGMSADYTFDMDKIFFKYNNHIPPKSFEFHKMVGRGPYHDTKLPSFMIAQYDRNSCNTFNEKNLKMNSYANGNLKQSISSFNNKKSFNYKLNNEKLKKKMDKEAQIGFENLVKKIIEQGIINNNESKSICENEVNNNSNNKNKVINSIPFRIKTMYKNFMSEYKRDNSYGNKVDGITFKSFKAINIKPKYCKEYNDF